MKKYMKVFNGRLREMKRVLAEIKGLETTDKIDWIKIIGKIRYLQQSVVVLERAAWDIHWRLIKAPEKHKDWHTNLFYQKKARKNE